MIKSSNMDKLFDAYNRGDSLLVVAGYPKKSELYSQGVCAVSSFTKNTLKTLQKENPGRKMVVLTMTLAGNEEIYEEDGILIIRCITRNKIGSYFGLLRYLSKFNKIKSVLFEFEFASFGNTTMTSLLLLVVWAVKFMGKDVNLVVHQVLFDLRKIYGHIGLSRNNPILSFFSFGLPIFYFLLCLPAKNVIVLEDEFKQRLAELIGVKKIALIPHGVDTDIRNGTTKNEAKEQIGTKKGEFMILCFGYLTWYKGSDFVINALKDIKSINGRKIKLVMAGGSSFTQGEKPHYKKFADKVFKSSRSENLVVTGFVEEKDIPLYFEAADLVILPYRVFMSSSGPLSLTFSFKRPFIMSTKLKKISESIDFKRAVDVLGIKESELFFNLNKDSLIKTIGSSMESQTMEKLEKLSAILNETRSFKNLGRSYDEILSPKEVKLLLEPSLTS